jgi:NAD-reducing hydrogenase small subunit
VPQKKLRLATVWLSAVAPAATCPFSTSTNGSSSCRKSPIVYSPIADVKEFPENVDVTVVEGAVANEDSLEMIRKVARTRILVSFGDCAVTGNVPSLRNPLGDPKVVLERAYIETADVQAQIPDGGNVLPSLLPKVVPVHHVVPVEAFIWGCPPSAEKIRAAIEGLLAGEQKVDPTSPKTATRHRKSKPHENRYD